MARHIRRTVGGVLLCLTAAVLVAGGIWQFSRADMSTDNAYTHADVTALAPKVGGYVTTVDVEDNQKVTKGEVLFRIDNRDYLARFEQATANVDAARARLANAEAEIDLQNAVIRQAQAQKRSAMAVLNLAIRESDRQHALVRSRAISQARVDESDAARTSAEAALSAAAASVDAQQRRVAVLVAQRDAAQASVTQAIASQKLARIDLDSTVVRAPVSGVIGNRQVRVGRLVAPGVTLLDIVPVEDVWVVANFKETQIAFIQPGQRARITIDGYAAGSFEGVVDSLAPGSGSTFSLIPSDNATGNFVRVVQRVPVKIKFIGEPFDGRLVPGLSVRVEIDSDQTSGAADTDTGSDRPVTIGPAS